jgi:hypothetical protein
VDSVFFWETGCPPTCNLWRGVDPYAALILRGRILSPLKILIAESHVFFLDPDAPAFIPAVWYFLSAGSAAVFRPKTVPPRLPGTQHVPNSPKTSRIITECFRSRFGRYYLGALSEQSRDLFFSVRFCLFRSFFLTVWFR